MEQRMSVVTLGVADLARARKFYEEVLGWRAAEGPPGVVFFDLGGLIFSLFPHEELAKDAGLPNAGVSPYRGFSLAHNLRSVEEVDALFAVLKKHNVTIVKPPQKVFWGGYSGYFADADGHLWEIAHNPFWTVREDGRVVMVKGA